MKTRFNMVKEGYCPLGHGKLDECSRCVTCSSNWFVLTPEDGRY